MGSCMYIVYRLSWNLLQVPLEFFIDASHSYPELVL